jgi:hypothetical protein
MLPHTGLRKKETLSLLFARTEAVALDGDLGFE